MALSLGVQKGSRLSIGGQVIEVIDIDLGYSVDVLVHGKIHHITENERTLILPQVYVSYGRNPNSNDQFGARLAFAAPREIQINRV